MQTLCHFLTNCQVMVSWSSCLVGLLTVLSRVVRKSWPAAAVYVEYRMYRRLHEFLKKWEKNSFLDKDFNWLILHLNRPATTRERKQSHNTYKFIERIVSSALPDTAVMSYGTEHGTLQAEVQDYHEQVDELSSQVKQQEAELIQMKSEVEKTKQELASTKRALKDVTNTQTIIQSESNRLQK